MSIAALNSLYASAVAAFDAGNYSSAISYATKAQMLLATTPNLQRSLGSGNQSITWNDGSAIEKFIANCRRLSKDSAISSGGPFRTSKVIYARPSDG